MKFLDLLLEGKKENLIDKYKDSETFAEAPELLEKLIDGDPSATKKYSEWMIKQMIGLGSPLTYSVADNVNLFIDLIEKFHKGATSITPDDVDYAASMSTLVDADKIKRGPKDINKYDSIWGLQAVMTAVDKRKIQKEKETEAKKDAIKIYEDDRFLIVEPETHRASCYYGANTKWCTTTKDDTRYFDKYTEEGSLYYIIDKKSPDNIFGKMALFVRNNGNTEVYDQKDGIRSMDVLLQKFEPLAGEIKKLATGSEHYEQLKGLADGSLDLRRVKIMDPMVEGIVKDGDGYKVKLNFDGAEKFIELFEDFLDEYEGQYIANVIEPPYAFELEHYDVYQWEDDLREGYYLWNLNKEHLEVLKNILDVYDPKIGDLIKETENGLDISREDADKIGEFMSKNFSSNYLDQLADVFVTAKNRSVEVGLQNEFIDGLCDILEEINVYQSKSNECFYNYEISLDDLLELYQSGDYFKDYTISSLLKGVVEQNISFPFSYPMEMAYESEDGTTFNEEFNDSTLDVLEKIYDELDDADYFVDFKEYMNLLEKVKAEFGINRNRPIPTQEGVSISIDGVDPETNKIKFKLKRFDSEKDAFEIKRGKAKLSTIYSMMDNYSLFDPFE